MTPKGTQQWPNHVGLDIFLAIFFGLGARSAPSGDLKPTDTQKRAPNQHVYIKHKIKTTKQNL